MIVVEGFDGSGKSTMAARIAEFLGWTLQHTGGPTIDMADVDRCLYRSKTRLGCEIVQDRITHVSEAVYSMLTRPEQAARALTSLPDLKQAKAVVYCRPPTAFLVKNALLHKPKSHETSDHVEWMIRHSAELVSIYDCVIAMVSRHTMVIRYDRTAEYQTTSDVLSIIGALIA